MKKYLTLFLIALVHIGFVNAQTDISGKVMDANGGSLPGVSIYLKGSSIGTVANIEGAFSLSVPVDFKNPVIVFSMIGFVTQEIPIKGQSKIDIVLIEDTTTLSEVVVTGYIAEERGKITGAVNTISGESLAKLPLPSIDQALQGRAPGVVVTQNTGAPGEGVSVRIRGSGSINSGNSPLYIVDGVPTQDINSLSPQDIANITVLKDAGASAIYGSRATNGVVIVTTKSGAGNSPKIQFSSQVGVQSPSRKVKMANTDEYVTIYNVAANNDNVGKPEFLIRPLITSDISDTLASVDYIDAIMRDGVLQTHSISVSGGSDKTRYFISGNYFGQEGIIKSSDYTRISTRINIDTEVKEWIRTGVSLNYSKANTNIIGSSGDGAGGNGGSVIRYAFFRTPAIPIFSEATGDYTDKPSDNYGGDNLYTNFFGDGYNPVGMLAYNNNELISNRLFGKFFFELSPIKDFKFTSNMGVDFISTNQRRFDRNWGTGDRINNKNQLSVSDGRVQALTFSNFATYSRTFDKHHFTFLLGTEAIKAQYYNVFAAEKDFPDQTSSLVYLGNGRGPRSVSESKSANALLSFFAKVNYDLSEKFLVTATLRRDGSSRLGPENRWGMFYAGSFGWRLDKEGFLINNKVIDRLLLRVGYGSIGNQEINDYAFTDRIESGYNYPFGNTNTSGYSVASLGNSKLKWETSNQLNVGTDLAMWSGKFSASLDYFRKITVDLLVEQPIASSSGADNSGFNHAIWLNNGKVLNEGIELGLNYANVIGGLHYSFSGNAATLRNEVLQIDTPIPDGRYGSANITLTEKGYPIGSFYLYEVKGIFQNNTDIFVSAYQGEGIKPGDVKYKDQNGDGLIDGRDRKLLGSAIPKVTVGLTVNLSYDNWDLSIFFQGAYGQKIFSVVNRDIEGFYRSFNVTKRYYDNYWTPDRPSNVYPRPSWDASGNNAIIYSSRFLEDGSYTRLKNLQIGYSVPQAILERFKISNFRIYFSGTNLFTFTRYSGLDPEMTVSNNAQGHGERASGLDWGTYPAAKSLNVGFNLTF